MYGEIKYINHLPYELTVIHVYRFRPIKNNIVPLLGPLGSQQRLKGIQIYHPSLKLIFL